MPKPSIRYNEWATALDSVLRELMTQMRLPDELTAQVDKLKNEMASREQQLPQLGRIVLQCIEGSGDAEEKCKRIIKEVGLACGDSPMSCGFNIGLFEKRLERYPDIRPNLPAILERGRVALKRLL